MILSALGLMINSALAQNMEPTPEFKKAFMDCYPNVPKDAQGKPANEPMEKCLATKGYVIHQIAPRVNDVFNECANSVKRDASGQPDKVAIKACMKSKGVDVQ